MKKIDVVAAIIIDQDKIFATQRGYGEFKDMWEFPGGKIEAGETPHKALLREIYEELDIEINVGDMLDNVEYDYPEFHLSMQCFLCTIKSGTILLKEHKSARWLTRDTIEEVNWLPADIGVVMKIKNLL